MPINVYSYVPKHFFAIIIITNITQTSIDSLNQQITWQKQYLRFKTLDKHRFILFFNAQLIFSKYNALQSFLKLQQKSQNQSRNTLREHYQNRKHQNLREISFINKISASYLILVHGHSNQNELEQAIILSQRMKESYRIQKENETKPTVINKCKWKKLFVNRASKKMSHFRKIDDLTANPQTQILQQAEMNPVQIPLFDYFNFSFVQ